MAKRRRKQGRKHRPGNPSPGPRTVPRPPSSPGHSSGAGRWIGLGLILLLCLNLDSSPVLTQENLPINLQEKIERERDRLTEERGDPDAEKRLSKLDTRSHQSSPFDRSQKRFETERHRMTTKADPLSKLRNRRRAGSTSRYPYEGRRTTLPPRDSRRGVLPRQDYRESSRYELREGEVGPGLARASHREDDRFPRSEAQGFEATRLPGRSFERPAGVDDALQERLRGGNVWSHSEEPRAVEAAELLGPQPPSNFERQLEAYINPEVDRPIRQFGYDVFRRLQTEPLDIPVGDDYVLGVGDHLVLTVWGNIDADHSGTIGRDGQIRLPQVGPVALKGYTLASAEERLRQAFSERHSNFELQLSLGRLRDMPVHVIGRAGRPGRARLPSVSTLFEALTRVGGVTRDGTLRKLVVRREGSPDRSIDLYDYLLEGNVEGDVSLQPNDVIVIPAVGSRVAIIGSVLRPAIYELEQAETSLEDVLEMAGGYARLANRREVQIEHVGPQGLTLSSVDLTSVSPGEVRLQDGDVVLVRDSSPRVDNVVYVDGNVTQPGRYAFRPGMRVSDLIDARTLVEAGFWTDRLSPASLSAEGELPEPYLDYALIRRIHPSTRQESRVPFDLAAAIFDEDPAENHLLKAQDTIIIFPRDEFDPPHAVYITGAVNRPGRLDFFEGMRVLDLIRMSGNLIPEAHQIDAVLTRIHPDQEGARAEHIKLNLADVHANRPEANLVLQPEDSLVIKTVPNYKKPFKVKVEGEVVQPGDYWVIPGERLSDVIERAGGFTPDAYLPAAQFFKESIKKLQTQRMEESLKRLEVESKIAAQQYSADVIAIQNISQRQGTATVEAEAQRIDSLIRTIRSTPPEGRMVLKIQDPEDLRGTSDDVLLEENDILVVPRRPEEINVIGAVFNQTALLHRSGMNVQDYIDECGGPTASADVERIFVIRADGSADSVQSFNQGFHWDSRRGRFSLGGLLKAELSPGDTVVVPFDVKPKLSQLGLTSAVSQILFQAAMATGVVIALL